MCFLFVWKYITKHQRVWKHIIPSGETQVNLVCCKQYKVYAFVVCGSPPGVWLHVDLAEVYFTSEAHDLQSACGWNVQYDLKLTVKTMRPLHLCNIHIQTDEYDPSREPLRKESSHAFWWIVRVCRSPCGWRYCLKVSDSGCLSPSPVFNALPLFR